MRNSQSATSFCAATVAGLPDPRSEGEMVNGTSLGPLFDNPHGTIEFEGGVNAAYSQFGKVSPWDIAPVFPRNQTHIMGYSTAPSIIERRPALFCLGHISPIFARFFAVFSLFSPS